VQFPHKRVCPILTRLIQLGGGSKVVFSPVGTYEERRQALTDKWVKGAVPMQDMMYVSDWLLGFDMPFKMAAKTSIGSGYEDYDGLVEEMVRNGGNPQNAGMCILFRFF